MGGLSGAAFGAAILWAAPALIPPGLIPESVTVGFDGRVLTFCALAAIVVAVLYGLSPAWQVTRMAPVQAMTNDGRTVTSSSARFRRVLAISQVAVAVFLLCGAGLLLRTLLALESVDSGSRASDMLTMVVGAGGPGPSTPESMRRKYEAYQREVCRFPECGPLPGPARCRLTVCGTGRAFKSTASHRARRPIAIWPAIKS